MKCPACDRDLKTKKIANSYEIDHCDGGCGGIWFDRFEITRVDKPNQSLGEIFKVFPTSMHVPVDPHRKRFCPKCHMIPLMRHTYNPKIQVEVDECLTCGGMWLDFGELQIIRKNYQAP